MANTLSNYLSNANLSNAAYARMHEVNGIWEVDRLQYGEGPAGESAYDEARESTLAIKSQGYTVINQYTDPATGLSTTLIQDADGHKTLAIRGTELSLSDLSADLALAVMGNTSQLTALQQYYEGLKGSGMISPDEQITVTGHSLGGFLTQIFTLSNSAGIDHAYTYNAPGIGGLAGELLSSMGMLNLAVPNSLITNIKNFDPVGRYGMSIGEVVLIPGFSHGIANLSSNIESMGRMNMLLTARKVVIPLLFNMFAAANPDNILVRTRSLFTTAEATAIVPVGPSPIILDLDGDGVETTNVADGAYFDHDGNGFAEQTGWAGADDGMLVRDINGNGTIDTGKELFGNETLLNNGTKATNGFQALADLDTNHDGKITTADTAWSSLKIWQDIDGDGFSSTDELHTLEELGVQSINTGYLSSTLIDPNGNEHKQVGSFTRTDGTAE